MTSAAAIPNISLNDENTIPALGIGVGELTEAQAEHAVSAALEIGVRLIDTAAAYGNEAAVGRAVAASGIPRAEIYVTTKLATEDQGFTKAQDACKASLERLGMDYVDLWQLHAWDDGTPLEETLAACDVAVSSGRVRYVGVSNFTGWQTAQAATWQRAWPGRTPLVSTQVEYSLLQRGVEREVVPAAEALGMGVLAWSPLGRGILTGKYRHSTPSESRGASPQWQGFIDGLRSPKSDRIVEAVITAAEGLGTTPLAVALAWVRDRPGVAAPVVGARTAHQLKASLDAETVRLPAAIRTALEDVSAPPFGYPERR